MSLPNIAGLTLEQKESLKRQQIGVGNFKDDETPTQMLISTCESSRNGMNLFQNNTNPTMLTIESEESKGPRRMDD